MSNQKPVFLMAGGRSSRGKGFDPVMQAVFKEIGKNSPTIAYVGVASENNRCFYGNGHEIPRSLLRGLKWPSPKGYSLSPVAIVPGLDASQLAAGLFTPFTLSSCTNWLVSKRTTLRQVSISSFEPFAKI